MKQKIKIDDIRNIPFGCQVQVVLLNGVIENAVVITGYFAFEDGIMLAFEEVDERMGVYLGWK